MLEAHPPTLQMGSERIMLPEPILVCAVLEPEPLYLDPSTFFLWAAVICFGHPKNVGKQMSQHLWLVSKVNPKLTILIGSSEPSTWQCRHFEPMNIPGKNSEIE